MQFKRNRITKDAGEFEWSLYSFSYVNVLHNKRQYAVNIHL